MACHKREREKCSSPHKCQWQLMFHGVGKSNWDARKDVRVMGGLAKCEPLGFGSDKVTRRDWVHFANLYGCTKIKEQTHMRD